jgi:hypothetical protein
MLRLPHHRQHGWSLQVAVFLIALATCESITLEANCTDCHSNANCTDYGNLTISCDCWLGYEGNGTYCEPNACELQTHDCDQNATCTKTPGSFTCSCKSGFAQNQSMIDGTEGSCSDIDECLSQTHQCVKPNFLCTNTLGSYSCSSPCAQCSAQASCYSVVTILDTSANESLSQDLSECSGNAKNLQDIGPYEMAERIHPSAWNDTINTNGTYRCICNLGYEGTGCSCTDVNECENSSVSYPQCIGETECINTPGSFYCGCKAGYTYNNASSNCTLCAIGQYKAFAGDFPCSECAQFGNGSTSTEEGSSKCLCVPGQQWSAADANCSACPRGKYSDQLSFECTVCPLGTYQVRTSMFFITASYSL